jgi:protein-tyrosine phosphatase
LEDGEANQLDLDDERSAVESNAMRFLSYPIPDRGTPASTREAVSLITQIVDQLDIGKNVIVHCRQGIGRSGLIAAGVFVTSGVGSNEALRAVSDARGVAVPETIEQRRWVEKLGSRIAVTKP